MNRLLLPPTMRWAARPPVAPATAELAGGWALDFDPTDLTQVLALRADDPHPDPQALRGLFTDPGTVEQAMWEGGSVDRPGPQVLTGPARLALTTWIHDNAGLPLPAHLTLTDVAVAAAAAGRHDLAAGLFAENLDAWIGHMHAVIADAPEPLAHTITALASAALASGLLTAAHHDALTPLAELAEVDLDELTRGLTDIDLTWDPATATTGAVRSRAAGGQQARGPVGFPVDRRLVAPGDNLVAFHDTAITLTRQPDHLVVTVEPHPLLDHGDAATSGLMVRHIPDDPATPQGHPAVLHWDATARVFTARLPIPEQPGGRPDVYTSWRPGDPVRRDWDDVVTEQHTADSIATTRLATAQHTLGQHQTAESTLSVATTWLPTTGTADPWLRSWRERIYNALTHDDGPAALLTAAATPTVAELWLAWRLIPTTNQ